MYHINSDIIQLAQRTATGKIPLGLFNGKMGYCIFFYELAENQKNPEYKKIAEELLNTICQNTTQHLPLDIENGLIGIGWGFHYLLRKKYISGIENDILEKFDIPVFKALSFTDHKPPLDIRIRIQFLFYLSFRLQVQKDNSEKEYIFTKLAFKILNSFIQFPTELWEEPYSFSIRYQLPFFLYSLGEVAKREKLYAKVENIVNELIPKITSTIPFLQAHKLYFLSGLLNLNRFFGITTWENHMQIIKKEIYLDHILKNELRNKNICFVDGISGILFLLSMYNTMADKNEAIFFEKEDFIKKFVSSEIWNNQDKMGIIDGVTLLQYVGL